MKYKRNYFSGCDDEGCRYDENQIITFDKDVRVLMEGGAGQSVVGSAIIAIM